MNRLSRRYQGAEGAHYDEQKQDTYAGNVRMAIRVLEPYLRDEDRILDFGCADGSLLAALPNREKFGVEVNPSSRAVACDRGLNVAESPKGFPEAVFDFIFSSHVLEHTLQPLDELRDLRRLLLFDGTLVLILPIDDWRAQRSWSMTDEDHHLYTWTPQLMTNLLIEAGYRPTSMEVLTWTLPGRFNGRLQSLLPDRLFDAVAWCTAVLRRRRQLVAVARVSVTES